MGMAVSVSLRDADHAPPTPPPAAGRCGRASRFLYVERRHDCHRRSRYQSSPREPDAATAPRTAKHNPWAACRALDIGLGRVSLLGIPALIGAPSRFLGGVLYISHSKVTFGGDLGTGTNPEQWACSLRLGYDGIDGMISSPSIGEENGIVNALKGWIANPNMGINQLATMRYVKFAWLDAAGHYVEDSSLHELPATIKGTAAPVAVKPFQTAMVVTLHTGKRGAQNRGRFYSPLPTMNLEPSGLFPAADIALIATATAQLISSINASLLQACQVIVASSKGHGSYVTGVTVGRVPDTVRSRRRSLQEQYVPDVAVTAL